MDDAFTAYKRYSSFSADQPPVTYTMMNGLPQEKFIDVCVPGTHLINRNTNQWWFVLACERDKPKAGYFTVTFWTSKGETRVFAYLINDDLQPNLCVLRLS